MKQKASIRHFNKYVLFMLVVFSWLFALPSGVLAEKHSTFVKIKDMKGDILISSSQTFLITDKTEVFDKDDRQIESGDLPVPCKAYIDYQLTAEGKAVALTIKVKQLLNVRRRIPE